MTLEPVFAAFFAVTLGDEAATLRMVVGGALVLTAMYAVELLARRRPGELPAEALHHEVGREPNPDRPRRLDDLAGGEVVESGLAGRSGLAEHLRDAAYARSSSPPRRQSRLSISATTNASSRLCWWFSRGSHTDS
jgi:hypothetical protein